MTPNDEISGEALQTIESEIRFLLLYSAGTEVKPGLEVALAAIQMAKAATSEYCDHSYDLSDRQEAEQADWEARAETETDCVPCLAETAPHTCEQPR